MMRYVAQRAKLWGTSLEESALVDMIAEGIKDARGEAVGWLVSWRYVGSWLDKLKV